MLKRSGFLRTHDFKENSGSQKYAMMSRDCGNLSQYKALSSQSTGHLEPVLEVTNNGRFGEFRQQQNYI